MENVIHKLTLDLTGPDAFPRVEVQKDNARTLVISLTQGGRPYWIAEGVTAVFSARKPDGNPLFNACTIEKNRVRYDFTEQTTNVAGIVECEILLYDSEGKRLASSRFELAIDELIHKDGDVPESAPEISALTQMVAAGTAMIEDLRAALAGLEGVEEILTQARAAEQAAEEAATQALEAADSARGAASAAEQSVNMANTARTAAESARTVAQTAQGKAQNAAAEAEATLLNAQQAANKAAANAVTASNAAAAALELSQTVGADKEAAQAAASAADASAADAQTQAQTAGNYAQQANSANNYAQQATYEAKIHAQNAGAAAENAAGCADRAEAAAARAEAAGGTGGGNTGGGGGIDADQLQEAVEDALEQAKVSGEFNGADGADGRGIKSIARTSGNGAAGTVDTYTITYTDGTKSTYQVRNGATGPQGPAYELTPNDMEAITAAVIEGLPKWSGGAY